MSSTFVSQKSSQHNSHWLEDFRHALFQTYSSQTIVDSCWLVDKREAFSDETLVKENKDLSKVIVDHLSSLLLKQDFIFNVCCV